MKRLLAMVLLVMMAAPVFAEVPKLINYSGKIVDKQGHVVADGDCDMIFALWDAASGGNKVWEEEHFTTVGQGVHTTAGGFNVVLGSIDPVGNSLPAFDKNYFVEVSFKKDTTWESFGRQQIISVPYAVRAEYANYGIPKGGIIIWQENSCPAGYSRVTALNGYFPRGATGNPGGTGNGSHSHTGTIGNTDIGHSHNVSGSTGEAGVQWDSDYGSHGSMGKHSHTVNIQSGGMSGNNPHNHSLTINPTIALPPYYDVVFCRKD